MNPFRHEPVMVDEVLSAIVPALEAGAPDPPVVVDATVGGGGHSRAILEANADVRVLGLDRDRDALAAAEAELDHFRARVTLRQRPFAALTDALDELGIAEIAGFLFDLGVSSPQLDRPERGFSYRGDGPLDMRMDREQPSSASDVVNTYDERALARVISEFGDERYAARIARAIVASRPITTTAELAEVVRDAIPAPARRRGGHPAKRTFQALRIEVNRELEQLPVALDGAIDRLCVNGRGLVLSYHSGEDRIVKSRFAHAVTGGCTCPPRLPCQCGALRRARLLWRGARTPSAGERARNPRAESARLRGLEKIA